MEVEEVKISQEQFLISSLMGSIVNNLEVEVVELNQIITDWSNSLVSYSQAIRITIMATDSPMGVDNFTTASMVVCLLVNLIMVIDIAHIAKSTRCLIKVDTTAIRLD